MKNSEKLMLVIAGIVLIVMFSFCFYVISRPDFGIKNLFEREQSHSWDNWEQKHSWDLDKTIRETSKLTQLKERNEMKKKLKELNNQLLCNYLRNNNLTQIKGDGYNCKIKEGSCFCF